MQRFTAKFLLLFALIGTLVPAALAMSAPAHACCVRKVVHSCHDKSPAAKLQISALGGCCDRNCLRAPVTARYAQPKLNLTSLALPTLSTRAPAQLSQTPTSAVTEFQPSRAPPTLNS